MANYQSSYTGAQHDQFVTRTQIVNLIQEERVSLLQYDTLSNFFNIKNSNDDTILSINWATGNIQSNEIATLGTTIYPFNSLILGGATTNIMTSESTNPKITFEEKTSLNNGIQPVHIIYTDYDSYRSPAGLKVVGGEAATPAWFEVEGAIYSGGSAYITGGIFSQHGHVLNTSGNEFNWIPDGYNNTMWFNYETFTRKNNGTISEYICGNGHHGHTAIRATAFNVSSSYWIKENIIDLTQEEAFKLLQVRPVSFDFKKNYGEKNQKGVIAEELEQVLPNLVNTPEITEKEPKPIKGVNYTGFIPYIIKLLQIQQDDINLIKQKLQLK